MKRHTIRKRRGQTLIEMVLAISMTAVVCTVAISTLLLGMGSWFRGQSRIDVEGPAQKAVRQMAMTLRTAMSVTVDPNGQGLTYRMPQVDGYGAFIQPATWDGITRRFELDGSYLNSIVGTGAPTAICQNVVTTDPLSSGGTSTYVVFTPGAGTITRSLTVMVVSQESAYGSTTPVYGRHRETIFLRNIPQLSQ